MLDVKHHYYSLMWHYREREKKEEDFCYQARAIFDIKASSVICKCRYLPPLLFWHCKVDFVTAAKLPPGFADCRIKVVTAEFTLQLEICVCSFDFALATVIFYWICICSSQTVAATASDKVRDGSGWDKGCVILWSMFEWINENFHTHTHTQKKNPCVFTARLPLPILRDNRCVIRWSVFAFLLPGCSNLARSVLLYVRRFRADY